LANSISRPQDQWQRKKQTKEEKNAAKRAKLDPDNAKSAKDVLDEQAANARKRKREEEDDVSEVEDLEPEAPIPSAAKKGKQTKKQRREEKGAAASDVSKEKEKAAVTEPEPDPEAIRKAKAEKNKEKREQRKAKEEAKAAKLKAKKERKIQEAALEEDSKAAAGVADGSNEEGEEDAVGGDIDRIVIDDIMDEAQDHPSSTATPSITRSPAFDTSVNHSGSSSISSIAPPATEQLQPKVPSQPTDASQPPKPTPEELRARLADRLAALRASRNADGIDGAPARNRRELMESRRQKEEQRRAHKKDLRQKAKEEERQKRNETLAHGSPLLSGSPLMSPGSPLTPSSENNFSFGRINFSNGQHASTNLSAILDSKTKPKGPSDPHTALLAAQNKQSRLNSLDETKRADIAEKDTWLSARKRAHGERIRDDTSLLKKTLKRKEKQKKKSEKEWTERIEGVKKGRDMRQKKREANLQKRKDEKGGKGGKKSKAAKKGKPKARPGFEGSFRAKAPSVAASSGQGPRRR